MRIVERSGGAGGAGLRLRGAVMWSVMAAVLVRAFCAASVPLLITNDSVWYFKWAREILAGRAVDWPPIRTPGYPLFLALVFRVSGVGPWGVLIAQHALGCIVVGLIAAMAARASGRPWWGLALGVFAALDPAMLAMESYALSEVLATALLVGCAAMVILPRRPGLPALVGLGVGLGALCLVRPAFQVVVPFVALGVVIGAASGPRWRARALAGAAAGAGFLTVLAPWLAHNWARGIPGLTGSNSVILWIGVAESGLLADDYPLPEHVRADYQRLVRPSPTNDGHVMEMVSDLEAWTNAANRRVLSRWALASVLGRPAAYAGATGEALGHQLGWFPRGSRFAHDEMRWMLWRLSQDGRPLGNRWANFNISGDPWDTDRFAMGPPRGPMRRWFGWWSRRGWLWVARAALAACAAGSVIMLIRRRCWPGALLMLGSLAYVAVHAAYLLSVPRYSAPCWALWWAAPAMLVGAVRPGRAACNSGGAPASQQGGA